jgi:hypothetical protein
MTIRLILKAVGVLVVLLVSTRVSSAVPQYVYCCDYGCESVLLTNCPDGGWQWQSACFDHCAA